MPATQQVHIDLQTLFYINPIQMQFFFAFYFADIGDFAWDYGGFGEFRSVGYGVGGLFQGVGWDVFDLRTGM